MHIKKVSYHDVLDIKAAEELIRNGLVVHTKPSKKIGNNFDMGDRGIGKTKLLVRLSEELDKPIVVYNHIGSRLIREYNNKVEVFTLEGLKGLPKFPNGVLIDENFILEQNQVVKTLKELGIPFSGFQIEYDRMGEY